MININIKIAKNVKFTTAAVGCFLRLPLTRHNLAYASLLARMQMNASLYYPTIQKQQALFANLYDLQFEIVPQLFGREIILSYLANFIEPSQVLDPDYHYETIVRQLALVIEHPSFAQDLLTFSQKQLLAEYQEIMAEPANFALDRFFKIWYQKTPDFADDFVGPVAEIKAATSAKLANFAVNLRDLPLTIVGVAENVPLMTQLVHRLFRQAGLLKVFKQNNLDIMAPSLKISRCEEQHNGQAQLYLGYGCPHLKPQEQITAAVVAQYLAGNQSSKLFSRVREQLGAAYAVEATSFVHNSLFLINMGLAPQQISTAKKIVEQELKKIKAKEIDPLLLRKAKKALANAYLLGQDRISFQLGQMLRQQLLPGYKEFDRLDAINKVSPAKMATFAKSLFLNESYVLK